MTETGVTIIDFNAMSEAISTYQQKVSSLNSVLQTMQAIQKALEVANIFSGGAATIVIEAIKKYISSLNSSIENLNQIIQQLQKKLESYQQAHQQAVNLANSIEQAQWAEV